MITGFATHHHLKKYRIDQFNQAFYQKFITSFDQLTTLSKDLRDKLDQEVPFSTIKKVGVQTSKDTNTTKYLFENNAQQRFETVLMRYKDGRNSICVSCMIGCPVGCTFCATGQMGFIANLSTREIVDQVLHIARDLKTQNQPVTNIIFMGMGEPLLNLQQVWPAIQTITHPDQVALGSRRITISTSGYATQIKQLITLGYKGRLAVSLHAPDQELRLKLMPHAASAYPLDTLFNSLDHFAHHTKKRLSYEYILIKNLNDQPQHAHLLGKLLTNRPAHVNLIPYNPVPHQDYERSPRSSVFAFSRILDKHQVQNSIRLTMGTDIKAACGQLATQ